MLGIKPIKDMKNNCFIAAGKALLKGVTGSRGRILNIAICVMVYFCVVNKGDAQSFGPPNIYYNGQIYIYSYTADDPVNPGTSYDYYYTPDGQNQIDIDQNHTVTGWGSVNYDPGSQTFNGAALVAVGSDMRSFLGVPPGLLVIFNNGIGQIYNGSNWQSPDYYFTTPNGINVAQFENISNGSIFQVGGSPYYIFNTQLTLDASSGMWPPSNIFPAPPQTVYVLASGDAAATVFSLGGSSASSSTGYYAEELDYRDQAGNFDLTIHRYYNMGSYSGDVAGVVDGNQYFTGSFDPIGLQFNSYSGSIQISLSSFSGGPGGGGGAPPRHGPLYISWNGVLLNYRSTDASGTDSYAGGFNSVTVTISASNSVAGYNPSYGSIGGSFDPNATIFNTSDPNFFALGADGNPIGLPPGLVMYFGYSGIGRSLLIANGSSASPSSANYFYQRPDGTWGVEYTGLLANSKFLVSDSVGTYNSQIYLTQNTTNQNQVINAIPGWPPTNIYPAQLYINGIVCTKVAGSQYDSGAGLPRNGGVSYRASAYDLTVVLSWTWDAATNFHGYVTGKYGQSASFKGNWDGLSNFSNMTNGAIASVTPPSPVPTDGNPPQISVNGSALKYDPLASAALANAGTPGDVYTGPLGQSLTIYQNGTVSFTPGTGATAITGSYNSGTHQFNFGSGNTVSLGNGNTAVVTATDTSGHNLSTLNGNTNADGVTELFGGLDIRGNTFSLGSWTSGTGVSQYAFGLAYTDASATQPGLLALSTTRAAVNWQWMHPSVDGGTDQVNAMVLDSVHRLFLYDPSDPATAGVILDPVGVSRFNGPIRIVPQGDILMGEFGN